MEKFMKKKCTKCGEIKELNEFHKRAKVKDGRQSSCKKCCSEAYRNRKYELTCQNPKCGVKFVTNNKKSKHCPNCRIKLRTKEEVKRDNELGSKVCGSCQQRKDFSEFVCTKVTPDGLTSICKQCARKKNSERTHNLTCQKPECGKNFISQCHARKTCYDLSLIHISEPTRPY